VIVFIVSSFFSSNPSKNLYKDKRISLSYEKMSFQTAKGVRDVPPEEKIIKNKVIGIIKKYFELYGFSPLETPTLERYETLAAKYGAGVGSDVLKETFKLTDQGKRKLGLRFEMTTSLARYIAENPNLKLPFKRYEVGRVFRDGPIKLGRYREFWQCDVDSIGTKSMLADAEQIAVLYSVFKELGFNFVIKVNNRKLLNGILNQAEIKEKKEALISIDKLDKIGEKGVSKELQDRGYKPVQIKKLFSLLSGSLREVKKKVIDEEGLEGIDELQELFSYLKQMGVKAEFDISLARGQAYYTGTVIEAYLKKSAITGSIAGGGRYDEMIGGYVGGGRKIPAVGVSFGIEPIMEALKLQQEMNKRSLAQVLVLPINTIKESLQICQELRENEIKVDLAMLKGVSKNLQYANALSIPYVIIIGENELKKKKFLLRDMNSGMEQMLTLKQLISELNSSNE